MYGAKEIFLTRYDFFKVREVRRGQGRVLRKKRSRKTFILLD